MLATAPNLISSHTTIANRTLKPARISVSVCNTLGQRVRTLITGEFVQDTRIFLWDGADDRNERVRSGVYFLHLNTEEIGGAAPVSLIKRIVLLR